MQNYHHKLIKRVEERQDERARIKAREEDYLSHMKSVNEGEMYAQTAFWCNSCQKDFEARGVKRIGYADIWPVAWYKAMCLCGKESIKRITDKSKDLYYFRSKIIKRQRGEYSNDLIDMTDPLFKVLYPREYLKNEQLRYDSA